MAEGDTSDALQGDWRKQFAEHDISAGWRSSINAAYTTVQSIPVKVLVWGPGRHSADYPKRVTVMQHVAQQHPKNEVNTSEDLLDVFSPPIGLSEYAVEEIHWREADLVLCIIARDSRITGSRTEIAKWGDDPDFISKAYLVTPKLTRRQREKLSFLDLGWHRFPPERKFEYTDIEYRDCTRIREYCTDAVQRMRNARGFHAWKRSRQ